MLLQVHRSGDAGSPRVSSTSIPSNVSTNVGSSCVTARRPAPRRRMRPLGNLAWCSISRMPFRMARRDNAHARLTRLTPPWPNDMASLAAISRHVRSSNSGHIARNFARRSASTLTGPQRSTPRQKLVPLFIYAALAEDSWQIPQVVGR